jgi:hypothetical protein
MSAPCRYGGDIKHPRCSVMQPTGINSTCRSARPAPQLGVELRTWASGLAVTMVGDSRSVALHAAWPFSMTSSPCPPLALAPGQTCARSAAENSCKSQMMRYRRCRQGDAAGADEKRSVLFCGTRAGQLRSQKRDACHL